MSTLLSEIQEKENELAPVTRRMDADTELIEVSERVLMDTGNPPAKIPNSIYVPLNDIKVFATTVESFLFDSDEQIEVTSEDENLDTAEIEAIIGAMWDAVDSRWSQGIGTGGRQFTYKPFTFQQTTRRGRTSHICAFRFENGVLVPDLRGWDSRYVAYRMDEKGLKWKSYLTTRSASTVRDEYPDAKNLPDAGDLQVRNIWTRKENIVLVGETEVLNVPHDYGYVPGVYQTVPLGSMTADVNSRAYEGESIFLMIRDLFPELVRLASYIQTLNSKEVDHALQEKVVPEDMDGNPPPDHDAVTDPRRVTKTTGGFTPIPIGELRAMAEWLHQMLETRMQRGGLSNFDMGTFNQAMSAVALIRIGSGRDRVYSPRLSTYGLAKINLTRMMIKQILHEVEKRKIKTLKINGQTYDLAILKTEYKLDYKYTIKDPTLDVAQQSLAVSQKGIIPKLSILRDTLKRKDPDGDIRELYSEEAEVFFPNIKRKRILKALAEKAEKGDEDAQQDLDIGLAELGISIDQLYAGNLPPVQPQVPEPAAEPMVDLFDNAASNMTRQ